jgi:hypothetical protein
VPPNALAAGFLLSYELNLNRSSTDAHWPIQLVTSSNVREKGNRIIS